MLLSCEIGLSTQMSESRRADSNRLSLRFTSALLTIWVRPNGFIAELRPYPPKAGTDATLNGLLVVAPTHRCSKTRMAPPLFM